MRIVKKISCAKAEKLELESQNWKARTKELKS